MESVPVRMHREKLVEDIFGTGDHDTNVLQAAQNRIQKLGGGVLIYLHQLCRCAPRKSGVPEQREERRSEWRSRSRGAVSIEQVSKIRLIAGAKWTMSVLRALG